MLRISGGPKLSGRQRLVSALRYVVLASLDGRDEIRRSLDQLPHAYARERVLWVSLQRFPGGQQVRQEGFEVVLLLVDQWQVVKPKLLALEVLAPAQHRVLERRVKLEHVLPLGRYEANLLNARGLPEAVVVGDDDQHMAIDEERHDDVSSLQHMVELHAQDCFGHDAPLCAWQGGTRRCGSG